MAKKPIKPITIERLIPLEWLGLTPNNLRWRETFRDGRKVYILSEEEVYVNIGISENTIVFDLGIRGYHVREHQLEVLILISGLTGQCFTLV